MHTHIKYLLLGFSRQSQYCNAGRPQTCSSHLLLSPECWDYRCTRPHGDTFEEFKLGPLHSCSQACQSASAQWGVIPGASLILLKGPEFYTPHAHFVSVHNADEARATANGIPLGWHSPAKAVAPAGILVGVPQLLHGSRDRDYVIKNVLETEKVLHAEGRAKRERKKERRA